MWEGTSQHHTAILSVQKTSMGQELGMKDEEAGKHKVGYSNLFRIYRNLNPENAETSFSIRYVCVR